MRDAVSLLSAALFFRAAALPCSRISAMACCALVLGAAFAAAFAASRCLRLGLPGSLLRSASTSGENLNVSHLSRMNLRISSSEGSAPNTTRARERTEREIEKLEGQLAALDAESEANATDYQKLMEIDARKQALNAQLEALYEAWEALCE